MADRKRGERVGGGVSAIYVSSPKVRCVVSTPVSDSGVPGFGYRSGKRAWRLIFAFFSQSR
jgi:hypothetical protein